MSIVNTISFELYRIKQNLKTAIEIYLINNTQKKNMKLNIQEQIWIQEDELGALPLGESVESDGNFDGWSLESSTMLFLLFRVLENGEWRKHACEGSILNQIRRGTCTSTTFFQKNVQVQP